MTGNRNRDRDHQRSKVTEGRVQKSGVAAIMSDAEYRKLKEQIQHLKKAKDPSYINEPELRRLVSTHLNKVTKKIQEWITQPNNHFNLSENHVREVQDCFRMPENIMEYTVVELDSLSQTAQLAILALEKDPEIGPFMKSWIVDGDILPEVELTRCGIWGVNVKVQHFAYKLGILSLGNQELYRRLQEKESDQSQEFFELQVERLRLLDDVKHKYRLALMMDDKAACISFSRLMVAVSAAVNTAELQPEEIQVREEIEAAKMQAERGRNP